MKLNNQDGTYDYDDYIKDSTEMNPDEFVLKYSELSLTRQEKAQNKLRYLENSMITALKNNFILDSLQVETWLNEIKEIRKLL